MTPALPRETANTDDAYRERSRTQRSVRVESAVQQGSRTEEPGCGGQRESRRGPAKRFFALVEPHCSIPQRPAVLAAGTTAVTARDPHAWIRAGPRRVPLFLVVLGDDQIGDVEGFPGVDHAGGAFLQDQGVSVVAARFGDDLPHFVE